MLNYFNLFDLFMNMSYVDTRQISVYIVAMFIVYPISVYQLASRHLLNRW